MINSIVKGLTIHPVMPDKGQKSMILKLTGALAGEHALSLKHAAEPLFLSPSIPELRLIMDDVRYIDSTGVGVIMSIVRNLMARGGKLEIKGLNEAGRQLFRILNLSMLDCIVITDE